MASAGQVVVYGRGGLIGRRLIIDDEIKRWKKGTRERREYSTPSTKKHPSHRPAKQVIVKSIWHNKVSENTKVENAFAYLSQEEKQKTEFDYFSQKKKAFCLVGEHGQHLTQEEFRELGQKWDRKNKDVDGRVACHLVFSIEEKPNKNHCLIIEESVRQIQNYYADQGFDCAFAVHQDTEHAHAHLMIRTKNNRTKKKLRLGKSDLFFLRYEFAKSLQKDGLNYCATSSKSPEYQDYLQEKQDKNYLLSIAQRDYGKTGEKLIKKSLIEQHDEGKAGKQAKQILTDFRACLRGDAQAKSQFEKSFADYSRLLEKYELKSKLKTYFAQLNDPRHIDMTVDYAYAMESKALKKARSEDVPSLQKLKTAKDFKDSLLAIAQNPSVELPSVPETRAVAKVIADFGNRQDENKALAQEIQKPNPYGEHGLIYMQFFHRIFSKTQDEEKRKEAKRKIENVQQGHIQQEHLDHFVFSLLKEEKQKDKFLAERKIFYQKKLAQSANVPPEQVELMETIFDQYFLQKQQNRYHASRQFFYTLQNYEKALADPQKLKRFTFAILQKNNQATLQR